MTKFKIGDKAIYYKILIKLIVLFAKISPDKYYFTLIHRKLWIERKLEILMINKFYKGKENG